MLIRLLKTSLAVRTAAIILLMVAVTGVAFLVLAAYLTSTGEKQRQSERLEGLLNTVENTVSIAAYLQDRELASEVVSGLIENPTVSAVRIRADEGLIAEAGAEASIEGQPPVGTLSREIRSPFDASEVVGRIDLVPNAAEIEQEVSRATRFVTVLLSVLLLLIGVGIVAVVIRLITRPILRISDRLHRLRAELGEKLEPPRGNRLDEIGRLVEDVNALIDNLVSILRDERELRHQREIEEKRLRTIFDNVESGIFTLDGSGAVVSGNASFARLFGVAQDPSVEPVPLVELIEPSADGQDAGEFIRVCLDRGEPASRDFRVPEADGVTGRWVNLVLTPLEAGQLQGIANDVTRRKLAEEAAEKRAATDALTGLSNRLAFENELETVFARDPGRREAQFAMLMIDLDGFKQVNDTHGHDAGDLVLIRVARLLEQSVRSADFIARLGGDEFVALLHGAGDRGSIAGVVEKFLAAVDEPVPIGHEATVAIGASVGIAIRGVDRNGKSDLIRHADKAMYRAKRAGGKCYRFYDELADEEAAGRR